MLRENGAVGEKRFCLVVCMTVWPQCPRPEPWNQEGDTAAGIFELGPACFI